MMRLRDPVPDAHEGGGYLLPQGSIAIGQATARCRQATAHVLSVAISPHCMSVPQILFDGDAFALRGADAKSGQRGYL